MERHTDLTRPGFLFVFTALCVVSVPLLLLLPECRYYGLHFNEREEKRHLSESEEEEEEEERIDLRKRLPPCIEEQKEQQGRLHYQLSYSVVFLTPDEMEDQVPLPFSPTQAQQLTQRQRQEAAEKAAGAGATTVAPPGEIIEV